MLVEVLRWLVGMVARVRVKQWLVWGEQVVRGFERLYVSTFTKSSPAVAFPFVDNNCLVLSHTDLRPRVQ